MDLSVLQFSLYVIVIVVSVAGSITGSMIGTKAEARRIWDQVLRNKDDISKLETLVDRSIERIHLDHNSLHERINRMYERIRNGAKLKDEKSSGD